MTRPDAKDLLATIRWQDELIAELLAAARQAHALINNFSQDVPGTARVVKSLRAVIDKANGGAS